MPAPDPSQTKKGKGAVFIERSISTLGLWALVSAAIYFANASLFAVILLLLGVVGMLEFFQIVAPDTEKRYKWWTLALGTIYFISGFVALEFEPGFLFEAFFLALHVLGLFSLSLLKPLDGKKTLTDLLCAIACFVYVPFLFSFLTRILYHPDTMRSGATYVLFLLAVTKLTDTGAYCVGSLIGKHKMIPHISPGKTWQGFGGAIVIATSASVLIWWLGKSHLTELDMTHAIILGVILSLAAVVGDLAESVLKRCGDVKDSGNFLPGIGGSLDLIDSILFTAPILYFYLAYAT